MESLVGQRLGGYLLQDELGRGSMGIVYRGLQVEQGYQAAVKVLLDGLASDQSFVTRFTREARIVRTLQHPNIVRLYEAGHEAGHIYFAMEYFPGNTAGYLLKHRGTLPAAQVVEIAAQAADALAYAHTHGHLVHRDIKPENLLVDRWCRVKVLDFGLARVEGLESITRAGTVVGSLYYVSAEQLLGRQLDGRADVYALGISMYEMLTGQRPYRGRTLTEMSDAILGGKPVPPSQLDPQVTVALESIVLRAMARDLNQRYASAGEMHADLRALQALQARATGGPALAHSADAPAPFAGTAPPLRLTLGPQPGPRRPAR